MYCKFSTDITKTIADVLQDLNRRHKDNRRFIARSFEKSQRQSPMYCKILTDVTKTIADVLQARYRSHKDNRRCIASSLQTSQRKSPMYCKILTDVTKTIADVLQDRSRSHKDNRRWTSFWEHCQWNMILGKLDWKSILMPLCKTLHYFSSFLVLKNEKEQKPF